MVIQGSEYLNELMHVFAMSLLIPTIVALLLALVWVMFELGAFIGESRQARLEESFDGNQFLQDLENFRAGKFRSWKDMITNCIWPDTTKRVVLDFVTTNLSSPENQQLSARWILEQEEAKAKRLLDKTDILAKVAPMLGLMGTLIPLGPGLSALGSGDLNALAQKLIIAFDATVVGLVIGILAFWITKVRQRRVISYLAVLEIILEGFLEVMNDAPPKVEANVAYANRRN